VLCPVFVLLRRWSWAAGGEPPRSASSVVVVKGAVRASDRELSDVVFSRMEELLHVRIACLQWRVCVYCYSKQRLPKNGWILAARRRSAGLLSAMRAYKAIPPQIYARRCSARAPEAA
jgi:hypothetical protein